MYKIIRFAHFGFWSISPSGFTEELFSAELSHSIGTEDFPVPGICFRDIFEASSQV
jgi:hypothetical protein